MRSNTKKEEVKQEVKLQEAFALWKNTSKTGTEYLKGKDFNGNTVVGFFNTNKKNPKEPDIRVYSVNAEGQNEKEIASLWDGESTKGTRYLSGSTDEKEKIVAFYNKNENVKQPHIRAYFKE